MGNGSDHVRGAAAKADLVVVRVVVGAAGRLVGRIGRVGRRADDVAVGVPPGRAANQLIIVLIRALALSLHSKLVGFLPDVVEAQNRPDPDRDERDQADQHNQEREQPVRDDPVDQDAHHEDRDADWRQILRAYDGGQVFPVAVLRPYDAVILRADDRAVRLAVLLKQADMSAQLEVSFDFVNESH